MRALSRKLKIRLGITILALVITAGLLINRIQTYDPFQGDAVVNPPFTSLTYGIQTFLWWDRRMSNLHLQWTRLMVFSHVKQIFPWNDIEKKRGEWDFFHADQVINEIEEKGLKVVVRLTDAPDWAHPSLNDNRDNFIDAPPDDLADFGTYCATIAERYKGRVAAYQIWNEPNLSREWGGKAPNAAEYVELLKVCSEAIHEADPAAIRISAGLAPTATYDATAHPDDVYFNAMYDANFQQYVDAVGMHAPGYSSPDLSLEETARQGIAHWATFRRVEDLRRIMVERGDAAHQVAILEFGWTTDPRPDSDYHWFAVSEEAQAHNLVAAYQYAAEHWRPWVGLMSAIYIGKPTWTPENEEYWWSITTP
ncbi:MAG: cellulase family glycosylhydrolase, partial [Anaerolineae bacterium]|nr:cellulase family glycosylhydrolase [Anaerolineae bacterium]